MLLELPLVLILVAMFGIAGVAKWRDQAGTAQATRAFGVPFALVAPIARLLPLVELGLAIGLLVPATRLAAAIGATGLLVGFTLLVGLALSRGRRFACHCFGQSDSAPIGGHTIARNLALAAAGGLLIWLQRDGPPGAWPALGPWQLAGLGVAGGLGLLALAQGYLIVLLMRQNGRILARLERLEQQPAPAALDPSPRPTIAQPAPAVAEQPFATLAGHELSLASLRAEGRPLLLVFADPFCPACEATLPVVAAWHQTHRARLTLVVISSGSARAHRRWGEDYGFPHVLLQQANELAEAFQVDWTPTALLMGADGAVREPAASGREAIEALLARVAARLEHSATGEAPLVPPTAAWPSEGTPTDDAVLEPLQPWLGQPLVALFWDATCQHCAGPLELAARLLQRPTDSQGGGRLVVVGSGPAALPPHDLPLIYDPEHRIAAALGVRGVPAAVLLSPAGAPTASPAHGTQAVTLLLQSMLEAPVASKV